MKHFAFLAGALMLALAARAVEPSSTLPVIYINTEGGVAVPAKTEPYAKATYYLDPRGAEGVEAVGSKDKPLDLQIRGRGNWTWTGFDKKPYRLKLDKKADLLGLGKSKHWTLLAHADDSQGFMRNATGFQLSRMLGMPWTPGDQPCEVVLNGDYIGLYFLTEHVRVDKDRVAVTSTDDAVEDWLAANPGMTAADYPWTDVQKTGGWLVEIDNYDDADQVKVPTKQVWGEYEQIIRVTYDTPSDYITQAQKQWLYDEFKSIDEMIFADDKSDCRWADKVDLTNAARFYLVNQIVGNYEGYHGSCKLSREQGADTKWNFGPVWDFGSAFQQYWSFQKPIWESQYFQHWIGEMYEFPAFAAEVKRLYAEFMDAGGMQEIMDYQDALADRIEVAARADKQRWPEYGNDDVKARVADVQEMLRKSFRYLNGRFGYVNPDEVEQPTHDLYLRGELNGWGAPEEHRFTDHGNGDWTLTIGELDGQFKIAGPDWNQGNVDYGAPRDGSDVPEFDTPMTLVKAGANLKISNAKGLTLIFNWPRKELTLSTKGYSGIADIDNEDGDDSAPAVYYNLQGSRVAHPEAGSLYIVVRGSKVTKELVR